MYLQRVSYNGDILWNENKQLIYRDGSINSSYDGMQLLADTSFGIIASCCFGCPNGLLILAQRVDYNGNLMWVSLEFI